MTGVRQGAVLVLMLLGAASAEMFHWGACQGEFDTRIAEKYLTAESKVKFDNYGMLYMTAWDPAPAEEFDFKCVRMTFNDDDTYELTYVMRNNSVDSRSGNGGFVKSADGIVLKLNDGLNTDDKFLMSLGSVSATLYPRAVESGELVAYTCWDEAFLFWMHKWESTYLWSTTKQDITIADSCVNNLFQDNWAISPGHMRRINQTQCDEWYAEAGA